jgi:glutathione S-transferase
MSCKLDQAKIGELMLELWQTEWCPASRRVRERLTELGVDYMVRQVPVDPDDRTLLEDATGSRTIPALTLEDGEAIAGEQPIRGYLDEHFREPTEATAHKARATKAHQRFLREECR